MSSETEVREKEKRRQSPQKRHGGEGGEEEQFNWRERRVAKEKSKCTADAS